MFDANGEIWGRIELRIGGVWVTVKAFGFTTKSAEVGCRQLGDELGYTPTSWSAVSKEDTPDGEGKQYQAWSCLGSENELSSCGSFREDTALPDHTTDTGLRCSFMLAGDECEKCPAGKFR